MHMSDCSVSESSELLEELEALSQENEQQSQTIQRLLLKNLELQSAVQTAEKKIQEQSGQIEKLNSSDKQLKEAKRYHDSAIAHQKLIEEKVKEISAAKRRADCKYSEAMQTYAAEKNLEQANKKKEAELDQHIDKAAERKVTVRIRQLEQKYRDKVNANNAFFVAAIFYGIVLTLAIAIGDQAVREDIEAFFMKIGASIFGLYHIAENVGYSVAGVMEQIPQPTLSAILYYVMFALILLGIMGVVFVGAAVMISWIGKYYYKNFWDKISAYVIMVTMAVLMGAGSFIREYTTVNLVLLFLVTQIAYVGIRTYLEKRTQIEK